VPDTVNAALETFALTVIEVVWAVIGDAKTNNNRSQMVGPREDIRYSIKELEPVEV
jgi:hypothetical protein